MKLKHLSPLILALLAACQSSPAPNSTPTLPKPSSRPDLDLRKDSGAPSLGFVSPIGHLPANSVILVGANLGSTTSVTFNGTAVTFAASGDNQLTVTLPSASNEGVFVVTTPNGSATYNTAPPTITALSVTSGTVGSTVTITGTRFTGTTSVSFNGAEANFTVDNAMQITARVPGGATDGKISVTNGTSTASNDSFDVGNKVWFVKADATGDKTGASWSAAFSDLQSALAAAQSGDEIWVAKGTYKPSQTNDRDASFTLVSNVKLYGGFAGSEKDASARDWQTNTTILSGDLDGNDNYTDESTTDLANNSYHVVKGANNATLDGFTITGGYAASGKTGGGLSLGNTAPTLSHLTVKNNYADGGGGALDVGSVTLTISDSSFSNNMSFLKNTKGGAILASGTTLSLSKVTFSGNQTSKIYNSGGEGGALHLTNGNLNLSGCTFSSNITAYYANKGSGGAIALDSSSATISESVFTDNQSSHYGTDAKGGALSANNSTISIVNSTFDQNVSSREGSPGRGGAIYASKGSLSITGTTFSNNITAEKAANGRGGAIYAESLKLSLNNDTFSGNKSGGGTSYGGAIHLVDSDDLSWSGLTFSNNAVSANRGGTGFGGAIFLLNSNRLKISDSSFSGNSAADKNSGQGGAIYAKADGLSLERVKFSANRGGSTNDCSGGALYTEGANLSITDVVATDNYAAGTLTGKGGAFYLSGNGTTIRNSVFAGNKACNTQTGCSGGAIYTSGDNFTLVNSVFSGNQAAPSSTGNGGGLYFAAAPAGASLSHLTFLNNRAPDAGAAIYSPGALSLSDSIIWDESVANPLAVTGSLTLNRSIVKGLAGLTVIGSDNLDSDPLFSNAATPAGADGTWRSSDDGLSLQASSPAIGRATGSTTTGDILGTPRDASPDAGAYEKQ